MHGTGHGHAVRALTIARHFRQHDFWFISHGTGAAILGREFPVVELASLVTVVHQQRVRPVATLRSNVKAAVGWRRLVGRYIKVVEQIRPDAVLADYELFLPLACRRLGLPCLNIDHQHVITACRHPSVPRSQRLSYLTTYLIIRCLYSFASQYLVTSFFRPPVKKGLMNLKLASPLLRAGVLARQPRPGEHVVAYQGYSTFQRFFPFLSSIPRPVYVYGFNLDKQEGNLIFKPTSEDGFLDDLASCAYVVCGGSHSLISEALYYGKPVFAFPIKDAFEQFINAFYLEHLGYGSYCLDFKPSPGLVAAFESKLPDFRRCLEEQSFNGNPEIFAALESFIASGSL